MGKTIAEKRKLPLKLDQRTSKQTAEAGKSSLSVYYYWEIEKIHIITANFLLFLLHNRSDFPIVMHKEEKH